MCWGPPCLTFLLPLQMGDWGSSRHGAVCEAAPEFQALRAGFALDEGEQGGRPLGSQQRLGRLLVEAGALHTLLNRLFLLQAWPTPLAAFTVFYSERSPWCEYAWRVGITVMGG